MTQCDINVDLIVQCINALAQGKYEQNITENDEITAALSELRITLERHCGQELSRIVSLSVRANETAISSSHLFYNLQEVDVEAQSVAAAAEEMAATVKQIGDYGKNISTQAEDAKESTRCGLDTAKIAVEGMQKITESVEESQEKVKKLNEFSENIGKISHDIKKIADKTNLLSLNATIEAARAGEAGKGFAVVAGEVKHLSEQTKESTVEIAKIIEHLQQESKGIMQSMQASVDAVTNGQSKISEVLKKINDIENKITEVSRNVDFISKSLEEQDLASAEIAEGITKLAKNSSNSVERLNSILDSMDQVEVLITEYINEMASFELKDKVIHIAQSDHVLWKKKLANMIIGRLGLNPDELADHHSCRLGKWYDSVEEQEIKDHPAFTALTSPHKDVHAHGIEAVRLFNAHNVAEALREIEKVEESSIVVLRLLRELAERDN